VELCGNIRKHLTPERTYDENLKRHEANIRRHQAGTCNWILEDHTFRAWKDPFSLGPPILCLSGPSGYGKSFLTSLAIQNITQTQASVAYYFCQFSQQSDSDHELLRLLARQPSQQSDSDHEVLRLLACQLFDIYFARGLPLDQGLCHEVLKSTTVSGVETVIRELVMNLRPTYFFFDGLDEVQNASIQCISTVIDFLARLCEEFGGQVRMWCSKRWQARPTECYEILVRPSIRPHAILEITNQTDADVISYLNSGFTELEARLDKNSEEGLTAADHDLVDFARDYLTSRAKGNFLWARLIMENLNGEKRVNNVKDLTRRVRNNHPEELDKLFRANFNVIQPEDRRIARYVHCLIIHCFG
jgi:hypothetical protein